jgi:hypothetical protein
MLSSGGFLFSMGEFYGSLQDIGLPEILGFLKGLNKTGSLRIGQGRWAAEAILESGHAKAASFGDEHGVAALEATMLALAGGSFTFTDGTPVAVEQNVELGPDELHERLTAFDTERKALAAAVPSLAAVPRVAKAPGTTGEVVLDGGAIETLLAVNGERTIADIAHAHGIVQTARELAKLLESGLINVEVPEADAQVSRMADDTAETDVKEEPAAPADRITPSENDDVRAGTNGRATPPSVPTEPSASLAPPAEQTSAPLDVAEAPSESMAPVEGTSSPVPPTDPEAPSLPASASPREAEAPAEEGVALAASGPCPKLGYVDDPANRYSRPTQLHRCFASGSAERVSTPEQRDLCLTNRFPSCPRFIAAGATVPAPTAEVAEPLADVTRRPVETRVSRTNGPERQPVRELKNGDSSRSYPAREAGASLTVRTPGAASRPSPRVTRPPREGAPAPVSEDRPARVQPAAPVEPPPASVEAPAPQDATPGPTTAATRRFAPALLLVTAAAIGTLAVVIIRASSALPEVSDAEVARLATAVASNPGSGVVPIAPVGAPPASGGPSAPLRTAMDLRFTEPLPGWPNNPSSTAWWADGEYHVLARQPGQFVAIGAPSTERFGEMVVSATFRKVGGPAGGGYGVIIRDQGPGPRDGVNQIGQYYVLEVGDRGEYGIWRREGDRWLDLIPWTQSELVPQGNVTNEVTVQATGQELTFLINGRVLANLVGAVLRDGGVGIFVGGDLNEVVVERFVVQTP